MASPQAATTRAFTSSSSPVREQPAAPLCPPPPNLAQTADASAGFVARMETFQTPPSRSLQRKAPAELPHLAHLAGNAVEIVFGSASLCDDVIRQAKHRALTVTVELHVAVQAFQQRYGSTAFGIKHQAVDLRGVRTVLQKVRRDAVRVCGSVRVAEAAVSVEMPV